MTYKILTDLRNNSCVQRTDDSSQIWVIPFSKNNTDYQQFKKDIQNGVVLNDAEGNPITGSALTTFMETLP